MCAVCVGYRAPGQSLFRAGAGRGPFFAFRGAPGAAGRRSRRARSVNCELSAGRPGETGPHTSVPPPPIISRVICSALLREAKKKKKINAPVSLPIGFRPECFSVSRPTPHPTHPLPVTDLSFFFIYFFFFRRRPSREKSPASRPARSATVPPPREQCWN